MWIFFKTTRHLCHSLSHLPTSCPVSPLSSLPTLLWSPNLCWFFQSHYWHFHTCSVYDWKQKHRAIVQSSWYLCPAWKQKVPAGQFSHYFQSSASVVLTCVWEDTGCSIGLTASLQLCPSPKRGPHVIHHALLSPRLSREGKPNHAARALAGPARWRGNMLHTLKGNNSYFQGVLGVAKCNSVKPSLHRRFTDFRGAVKDLHS